MTHVSDIITAGRALDAAEKVLIMVHGRGGSAEDILALAQHIRVDGYALLAPQATNHTWYPLSFMAPVTDNEPWLRSAIDVLSQTVQHAVDAGVKHRDIYFFGFSQGACLILEFLARHATRYGGAAAIIGGVIGAQIDQRPYQGDFQGMPIFLGTSNPDFHVPLERVQATADILNEMNAKVTLQIYDGFGHSIHPDQIDRINRLLFA